MNKKLIFTSLATSALLAACTSDELMPQANEVADIFASRPKIDVAFGVDSPVTRMTGDETQVNYDVKDFLGAVLVDQGEVTEENYFDLVTANTHIGNNKFYYEDPKFVTDGTMCVGAWLFYANYDEANTKSRGSIKYKMPIVQEYAQDFKEIAKHDFKFSPIVNLVGQENGYFNYNIPTISAFTYANVKLHFDKEVVVQKLVLKPYDKDVATGENYDPFFGTYELNMGNGSGNSGLSCAVADLNNVPHYSGDTNQKCLDAAKTKLLNKANYISATVGSGSANKQIVALNCLDSELAPSKDFQTLMVIPSGQYEGIRLYAYTDKGVYVYNINDEFEAIATDKRTANHAADNTGILLKRERVSLHNIADLSSNGDAVFADANKYLNMTEVKTHQQLQTKEETEGIVVISQKDLLTVISSIGKKGDHIIRVLGNMVKIDEEVAKAIADKEKKLGGDIQLIFANFYDYEKDQSISIEGNAEGYTLTDVTFQILAKQTSGKVKLGVDINIPNGSSYTVDNGATAEIVANANKIVPYDYEYEKFINNGTLIGDSKDVVINIIENNAAVVFKKNANVTNLKNIDKATARVEKDVTLTAAVNNISCGKTHVHGGAVVTNDGTINLNGESVNNRDSKIINNGIIQIKNITWTNNGTIENAKDAKIISGDAHFDGGMFMNTTYGNITNYGFMYCYNGENYIYNEGTINAKNGSTTYITRNSKEDEAATETRSNTMGTINMDNRNEDISVTSTHYQGYLTFTTAELAEIRDKDEDKFNKVILKANATVDDAKVKYIVTEGAKLTVKNSAVQELIFKKSCTLITTSATVAYLEIEKDQIVKLPTENVIAIENIYTTETSTKAKIYNKGTLLVGGDLWSTAIVDCPTTGIFASGDGTKTAFHWGEQKK